LYIFYNYRAVKYVAQITIHKTNGVSISSVSPKPKAPILLHDPYCHVLES
jgi:hypothetical protein